MIETPKVGQIITGTAYRDAIHVAVAPVVAGRDLNPGDRVGFLEDGTVGTRAEEIIGIVDPYLVGDVPRGSRFYLFLMPGTVTSLRHAWQHPAFKVKVPGGEA